MVTSYTVVDLNPKQLSVPDLAKAIQSQGSYNLCPDPALSDSLLSSNPELKDHFWLASSGTQKKKLIALSRSALFCSAESVNSWIEAERQDVWAIALPLAHIGAFSIVVRSLHAQFGVQQYTEKWQPFNFCNFLAKNKCSLASLVPTQVHDLLAKNLEAPPYLRAVLVGGGSLDPSLYQKARELKWPLLPSYGLTECSSQVATASLKSLQTFESPSLQVLPHVKCEVSEDGLLKLESKALMSAYVEFGIAQAARLVLRGSEAFETSDLAEVFQDDTMANQTCLKILGRADRQVKIKGSLVSLDYLDSLIRNFFAKKSLQILSAVNCEDEIRNGAKIILHVSAGSNVTGLLVELNTFLLSENPGLPEVRAVVEHSNFPLLKNGKIDYSALKA